MRGGGEDGEQKNPQTKSLKSMINSNSLKNVFAKRVKRKKFSTVSSERAEVK